MADGQANLFIGSTSMPPGGTAVVEVLIQTTGGAFVSSLQFDFKFDSSRLEVGDVTSGEAASQAGKEVAWNLLSPGVVRILVIGFNSTPMGQGELVVVSLRALDDAPAGQTPLTGGNAAASDAVGQAILIDVFEGHVTITAGLLEFCCPWVLPAAANATGLEGSFWQTDLAIESSSAEATEVAVIFGPSGQDNTNAARVPVSVAAGELLVLEDVVGSLFGESERVGAIFLDSDTIDLRVASRTFNSGGPSGTFGQGIPAEELGELLTLGEVARLFPVSGEAGFRSNLGLVNAAGISADVLVRLIDAKNIEKAVFTFTLPPWSHLQITDVLESWDVTLTGGDGRLLIVPQTTGTRVAAYLSVVDDLSGDPSYYKALR